MENIPVGEMAGDGVDWVEVQYAPIAIHIDQYFYFIPFTSLKPPLKKYQVQGGGIPG